MKITKGPIKEALDKAINQFIKEQQETKEKRKRNAK
jgi:hypothetical protein